MNALAALASFAIPGLGQLIQGRLLAACFFFFGSIALFVIAFLTVGVGLIVALPFYVWAILNAANFKTPLMRQMEK